jgi:tetratricopeptide (TPR) repeat protein
LAYAATAAADETPPSTGAAATSQELDAIRDQIVALKIEQAIAALNAILERPGLAEATQVDALDLRAEAHAASGDLDDAEKDYRAILELRPGYAPNPQATAKKAMARFAKTKAAMVGTIHLDLDPKDAALTVDDRPVTVLADGAVPMVAGERRLRFTRRGFDTLDDVAHAVAGQDTLLKIRLVPNARNVVVRTDVDGVSVTLDGVAAGVTARDTGQGSAPGAASVLVLDDVGIGEHELRLSKSCYATETREEIVSVDLADRSAKLLPVGVMQPARTRVTATGAGYDGELRVDGERIAALPATSFAICPGSRLIESYASGRVVWSGTVAADETDLTLDLTPRPNAVLVGPAWPASWVATASGWSLRGRIDAPTGVDLSTRDGWGQVALPPGTDLAVAVIPGSGVTGADRTVLYSPALHEVADPATAPPAAPPVFTVATLGAALVDGDAGAVVLASVDAGGAAEKAGLMRGDRVLAVSGRAAANAAAARTTIVELGPRAKVALDVVSPSGGPRKVECVTDAEPRLPAFRGDDASRVLCAAWAVVEAASGGADAGPALAGLASLLESAGQGAASLDAWRRVRATGGGRLAARAAYAIGAGFQAEGKRAEALEAFQQAKSEAAQLGDAALEAAANDRLADLGVVPR